MKDYYKILGVDEDASTEHIRACWIELTKNYHPDLGKTNRGDEKIKEINEAYEILKDDSKRLDYDFQRTLKKSIRKKVRAGGEKRFLSKKTVLPAGLVVFFLMGSLALIRSLWVYIQPKSELRLHISKILDPKPVSPVPPPGVKREVKEEVEVGRKTQREIPPPSLSPAGEKLKPKEDLVLKGEMKSEMPGKMDQEVPKEASPVTLQPEGKWKLETNEEKEVPKEINQAISQETANIDPPRPIVTGSPSVQKPENSMRAEREGILPSPLLASEEEVEQFLSDYINRYIRKDVLGFLSLFSLRAVQNQKDDFEKVKSIYTQFFEQSEELRYSLKGVEIDIYQNLVEVKAGFKVDQKLKKRGREKIWAGPIRWVLTRENGALKIISIDYQHQKNP